jgi:acyl-coenzyme A synthetase/AMP-(fatty) acid ligase
MPENLSDLWLASVQQAPTKTALIESENGRQWSRAALNDAATTWINQLPSPTSFKGNRVALAEPNGPQWLVIFIALMRLGAICVPLDPAEPTEARQALAKAVGARWLCSKDSLVPIENRRRPSPADACLIKLTSGSTGTPKALLFTHGQMIADGRQICASMDIRPEDINLGVIPFGHSYGLGNLVVPLLVQGTAIVATGSPLPNALADACQRWRPTVFPAVPTLLRALAHAEVEPTAISSLRLVISAGAPLSAEIALSFHERFRIRIHSFYGSSETGGITFDREGDSTLQGRSVGLPMQGVTLHFQKGGRFIVASSAVLGNGRHAPPDKGRLNEHGELVLLGRSGRTAKIAGRRLDLSEVEKLIRSIPGVIDAMAMTHPGRADALAAAVSSGSLQAGDIRQALRSRTALWKIPERILVLRELPVTSRGKVDRKKVQQLLGA